MLVDSADMSASMILHEKLVGKLEHAVARIYALERHVAALMKGP